MKARIIEVEREEIAPGIFRRVMWSNVPVDKLSYDDTQEFCNRMDELWSEKEAISSLTMRKIQQDKKKRPYHFFESISFPPEKEKVTRSDYSNN